MRYLSDWAASTHIDYEGRRITKISGKLGKLSVLLSLTDQERLHFIEMLAGAGGAMAIETICASSVALKANGWMMIDEELLGLRKAQ